MSLPVTDKINYYPPPNSNNGCNDMPSLSDIVADPALEQYLASADYLLQFERAIQINAHVSFRDDTATINFIGHRPESDGWVMPISDEEFQKPHIFEIDNLFDMVYYTLLERYDWHRTHYSFPIIDMAPENDSQQARQAFDKSVKTLATCMGLLVIATRWYMEDPTMPPDTMSHLAPVCIAPLAPIFGTRNIMRTVNDITLGRILEQYPDGTCGELSPNALRVLTRNLRATGDFRATYTCSNLYQLCGAILDYLYNHFLDEKRRKRYMLRECENCNHFFIAVSGHQKYCTRNNGPDGLPCAKGVASDAFKAFVASKSSDPDTQLYNSIRRRLNAYRVAAENSALPESSSEIARRENLCERWKAENKRRKASANYGQWLASAQAHLPKQKEGYEHFVEWLSEQEVNSI